MQLKTCPNASHFHKPVSLYIFGAPGSLRVRCSGSSRLHLHISSSCLLTAAAIRYQPFSSHPARINLSLKAQNKDD
jgi:hypothetical protein